MLSCHISTPANFLHLQISKEVQKRNVNVLLLVSSQLGVNQPTHAGLGCHSNRFEIHLLVLSPTQTHTCMHTLSFLRDKSVRLRRYLFLPYLAGLRDPPSEKLTGPVQFPASSPLSRLNCCELVRKSVSLFGIYWLYSSHTWEKVPLMNHKWHFHPHLYIRGTIVFQVWPSFVGFPLSQEWSRQSHFAVLAQKSVRHESESIKVTVI